MKNQLLLFQQFEAITREPQLNGKAQYGWPPRTNWFISAAFDIPNIIYFIYLNDEVNRTEPFSIPWYNLSSVCTSDHAKRML